jgi:hypothetical protein
MHAGENGRIVMAGESDSGAERVQTLQAPAGAANLPEVVALKAALAPIGVTFNPEPAKFGGDDIAGLYALGTPVMSMRQDVTHYFDLHHSADDTLDKVNPKALDQNVAAWATAIYIAADSTVDLRTAAPAKP